MEKTLYYLHTLSALHIGIGQGSGVIDLPIARERATQLPQVPGSSVKGVLRSEFRLSTSEQQDTDDSKLDFLALFGPETSDDPSAYAGALAVGDGRLLALPVRSWRGTFAWATCPLILQRYRRDLNDIGAQELPKVPKPQSEQALRTSNSVLTDGDKIYLEDSDLNHQDHANVDAWAELIAKEYGHEVEEFKQRFLILPDDFFDFLSETATEVRTRISIDTNTQTVKPGALWTEEYLPAESLFWGLLASDKPRNRSQKDAAGLLALLNNRTIQLGGNATTGGGQTRWIKRGQTS